MSKKIIVKMQISVSTSEGAQQVLVYDETRKFMHQDDVDEQVREVMGDDLKKFFYATIENKNFVLHGPAPWQSW